MQRCLHARVRIERQQNFVRRADRGAEVPELRRRYRVAKRDIGRPYDLAEGFPDDRTGGGALGDGKNCNQ